MTISATYSPAQASGNGATVAFPFTFKVFSQTDLTVILTSSAGVNTTQAITTDYTVSINADQNNNPGGTVTMLTAPATGETLIITRVIEEIQETDIANGGGFYPEVLEDALDRLTMLNQQNTATTNRALVAPLAEASIDTLPSIVDRASKYLAFDADGQPVATSGTANAFIVTGFAETLLDDANAAAARATLGSTTVGDAVFVAATAAAARTALDAPSTGDLSFASANTAGQFNNLGLSVAMAANACTVALKGADGNDPSASNPVTIAFRSATDTNGGSSSVAVTAATSVVIPNGATLGTVSNLWSRVWVVAINNSGTVELAVINCVKATARDAVEAVAAFRDSDPINSTTAIGTGSDSSGTMYSTSARTNVPYTVLGAFDSSQATAGAWAASASTIHVNPPFRPGQVLSERTLVDGAVATGTTTIPDDDTIPQVTEGDQFMQSPAVISTITSAPNVFIVSASANYSNSASVVETMALHVSGFGTNDAVAAVQGKAQALGVMHSLSLTKALITGGSSPFYIRLGGASAGTTTFNGVAGVRKMGGVMASSMRVTEISA